MLLNQGLPLARTKVCHLLVLRGAAMSGPQLLHCTMLPSCCGMSRCQTFRARIREMLGFPVALASPSASPVLQRNEGMSCCASKQQIDLKPPVNACSFPEEVYHSSLNSPADSRGILPPSQNTHGEGGGVHPHQNLCRSCCLLCQSSYLPQGLRSGGGKGYQMALLFQ